MEEKFNFKVEDLVDAKSIAKSLSQKLNDEISNSITWKVQDIAKQKVLEAIEPEIALIIEDSKETILQGIRESMPDVAKALATQMMENATKNLNGYYGKDILKKLFAD